MKTIKQLADELKVSKTAVRNYMDDSFRESYTEKDSKGVITINDDGCKIIAESIAKFSQSDTNHFAESSGNSENITIPKSVFAMMERQIEHLQQELDAEREHSRKLANDISNLADQSQKLHFTEQKVQLLEAPKKKFNLKFWEKGRE